MKPKGLAWFSRYLHPNLTGGSMESHIFRLFSGTFVYHFAAQESKMSNPSDAPPEAP